MTLLSSYWSIDDLTELLLVHWWPCSAPIGPVFWYNIYIHSQYIDPNQISCRTDLLFGPKHVRVCFGPKHSCFGLKHVCFGVCLGLQLTFLPSFPSQTRVDRSDMVSGWSAAAGNTFRFNSHPSNSWHKKIFKSFRIRNEITYIYWYIHSRVTTNQKHEYVEKTYSMLNCPIWCTLSP